VIFAGDRDSGQMTEFEKFESFMAAYQDMVFATAVRLLGREADAEDISQEVFLRAYERFEDLSRSQTCGGWLKTVTRNLCLNHLSRYRARWHFFSEMGTAGENDELPFDVAAEETQDRDCAIADQREILEQALRRLPDAQRVPIVLYHFEEMSYEEIAEHMGVSLAKVKSSIFRGRELLRKKLKLDVEGYLAGRVGIDASRLSGAAMQKV
jgi:RNA polymerase sigma-70 factor (ECF subfamily)